MPPPPELPTFQPPSPHASTSHKGKEHLSRHERETIVLVTQESTPSPTAVLSNTTLGSMVSVLFLPVPWPATEIIYDQSSLWWWNCFYLSHVNLLSQENLSKITLSYAKWLLQSYPTQRVKSHVYTNKKLRMFTVTLTTLSLPTPLPLWIPTRGANWWISISQASFHCWQHKHSEEQMLPSSWVFSYSTLKLSEALV